MKLRQGRILPHSRPRIMPAIFAGRSHGWVSCESCGIGAGECSAWLVSEHGPLGQTSDARNTSSFTSGEEVKSPL